MTEEYSYNKMVADWGYEVIEMKEFGSYQGDYAVVLRDGDKYGWVTIGYGSCSGCDTMEYLDYGGADDPENEYIQFSDDTRSQIKWDSAKNLADWLSDIYIQEGKYSWYEDGYREFLGEMVTKLRNP